MDRRNCLWKEGLRWGAVAKGEWRCQDIDISIRLPGQNIEGLSLQVDEVSQHLIGHGNDL